MNPEILSREIVARNPAEVIAYISENRSAIRAMFLKEWDAKDYKSAFENVLKTICIKGFSTAQKEGVEIQSLFVHLAYYFKRIGVGAYISTAYSKIVNPYFKLRLEAWRKYEKNHDFAEHVKQLKPYLQLLSNAQDQVDDGNYNELLNDLAEYIEYVDANLSKEYKEQLHALIESEDLREEFPLLKQFHEKNASRVPNLEVIAYDGKELEPSEFAYSLFEEKFLGDIRRRSQPNFPHKLMGYPSSDVRYDIIGRGQADFDQKYKNLEASDRVNLYCYFNMRMHFFSSVSLYERSKIIDKYYNTAGKIKFVDIGCGPATSGIAFADYLHKHTDQEVIFDYFGIDIAENMQQKADDMLSNAIFSDKNGRKFYKEITKVDVEEFKDASCIIINCCYVFASLSLPYKKIADYLNKLTETYPYVPKYVMYQNATAESLNRNYIEFKKLLIYEMEWTGNEEIRYHNSPNSFYDPKVRSVYYEILRLS
ncbi:hypothetical protein ACEN2P_05330 [Pedobacter psychrotolerans]|uniref:hypothetical protein n=1 Tax=Pedobacter psychrotolerans TaxID=1843235 RepID=UPI003F949511